MWVHWYLFSILVRRRDYWNDYWSYWNFSNQFGKSAAIFGYQLWAHGKSLQNFPEQIEGNDMANSSKATVKPLRDFR